MRKLLAALTLATAVVIPFWADAVAGPPGAFYQQQQRGYPQSPPGGA
jgi:hypothetical protein